MSVLCAKFQRDTWKGLIVLGNKIQNLYNLIAFKNHTDILPTKYLYLL